MANITAIIGVSGSGKTLMLANLAKHHYFEEQRIYSNFHLNLDGDDIDFKTRRKTGNLNYTPLFTPADLGTIQNGSVVVIDEIDMFGSESHSERGADSYAYRNEASTTVERYFKKRLRKTHCTVYYTCQQLKMVPNRIRDETLKVYEPRVYMWGVYGDDIVPYIVHYSIRKLNNITGNHDLTGEVKLMVHPVFGHYPHPDFGYIKHVTPDMLTVYDTDADPFRPAESGMFFGQTDDEEAAEQISRYQCEVMTYKAFNKALPEATVMTYPNSGCNSKRCGDMEIEFPTEYGIPKIIVEVKGGSREYTEDNQMKNIKITNPDGLKTNWGEALAHDKQFGTIHVIAIPNLKTEEIFVFGLNDNYNYIKDKTKLAFSKLNGVLEIEDFCKMLKQKKKNLSIGDRILSISNVLQSPAPARAVA